MKKFKKFEFAKNVLSTMFNQLKFLKMKKVTLLVIAVLFSLSACMKFELPKTTEQGSNKEINNGKTDKTEDQQTKPDPEEEQYGTGVLLTPQEDYVKIPLASMPVLGDQTLPESYMLPIPDWTGSIDQGVFGTCLAQSTVMALTVEVSNKKRKIPYEQRDLAYFSPAFLYSLGRLPGNCASAGMTVDGVMEVLKTNGVCPIKYMPYNKRVCPSGTPSAEAFKIASKTKIRGYQRAPLEEEKLKQLVYSGKPIILIVEANNAFKKAFFKGSIWGRGAETPKPKGDNLHAILLTGYTQSTLVALNSWGPGGQKDGRVLISPEMLGSFVLQAYVIDTYQSYPPLDDNEDQEDDTPKPEPQTIQVDQSELKFETTTIGQKTAKVLQITMTSGEDTQLSLNLSDPNFEVVEKEINLFKNKKKAIQIFYIPKSPASHTGTLTISSPAGYLYKVIKLYGSAKEKEPEPKPNPIPEPQPTPIPEPKPVPQPQPEPKPRYTIREIRPSSNLRKAYCGDNSMGVTYAGHIGIDENGCIVEDIGNQLQVTLKVIKIDDKPTFTHSGFLYAKVGENFCTETYTKESYRGGGRFVNITFTMDKSQNTVWVLAKSDNGYRFYTKVRVERQ